MSALIYGIDVHKKSTFATTLGPDGEIVTQKKKPNDEVPDFLRAQPVKKVATEASTTITPLHRKLTEEGYNVTVYHPRKTMYIAETRIKLDRVDYWALAELLRFNSFSESYMPSKPSGNSGKGYVAKSHARRSHPNINGRGLSCLNT